MADGCSNKRRKVEAEFSVLAAILGCDDSEEPVPEAWLVLLVQDYMDAKSRLALFRTNKTAWACVLRMAKHARAQLDAQAVHTPCSATMVQQALLTRGEQPATLVINEQYCLNSNVLMQLRSISHCITNLGLNFPAFSLMGDQASYLAHAIQTFPAITQLAISNVSHALPSAAALPQVRQLQVKTIPFLDNTTRPAIITSLHPYLGKITSLQLDMSELQPTQLFSTIITTTLTTLDISATTLDTPTVDLLAVHAPALRILKVAEVDVQTAPTAATWPLTELHSVKAFHCDPLALLPDPSPGVGKLAIHGREGEGKLKLTVGEQGASPAALKCMNNLTIARIKTVTLLASAAALAADQQLSALSHCLDQLQQADLPSQCQILQLKLWWGWGQGTFRPAMLLVTERLPAPFVDISVGPLAVRDEEMEVLLQHGDKIKHVEFSNVNLTSTRFRNQPWPWDSTTIRLTVHARQLALLPDPGSEQRELRCDGITFDLNSQQVKDAAYLGKLRNRLAHLLFQCKDKWLAAIHAPRAVSAADQPAALSALLEVARHMQYTCPQYSTLMLPALPVVKMCGWIMTEGVIQSLAGLPQKDARALAFWNMDWSATASSSSSAGGGSANSSDHLLVLADHVPQNYLWWTIYGPICTASLTALVTGLARRQKRDVASGQSVGIWVGESAAAREAAKAALQAEGLDKYLMLSP